MMTLFAMINPTFLLRTISIFSVIILATAASFQDEIPSKFMVREMADLSKSIYHAEDMERGTSPIDALGPQKDRWDFKLYLDAEDGTQAWILKSKSSWSGSTQKVAIIFRGTDDREDWFTNLEMNRDVNQFQNAPANVELHAGFQESIFDKQGISVISADKTESHYSSSVKEIITTRIVPLLSDTNQLWTAGHSLGGALSLITAVYAADKWPTLKVSTISFGAPRVGNKAFKDFTWNKSNLCIWRYVNNFDTISRSPPRSLGYHHVGHTAQLWPGDYTSLHWRHVGGGNYLGVPWSWYYGFSINDHRMDEYFKIIKDKYNDAKYWPTRFEQKEVVVKKCPWYGCW